MKRKGVGEEDYGYLHEEHRSVLPMIAGGAALIIVIGILCVLIWQLAHSQKPQAGGGQMAQNVADDTLIALGGTVKSPGEKSPSRNEAVEEKDAVTGTGSAQKESGEGKPEPDNVVEGSGEDKAKEPESEQSITMVFKDVREPVTAKDVTNLRSEPGTQRDETIVAQLKNGEAAMRTGINAESGWSRVEYEGVTLYAVSRLLTTDMTVKEKEEDTQAAAGSNTVTTAAGRKITFTPCDDTVSPKMEVNLRREPSTSQGESTVYHLLAYGEKVRRTGYDTASGWSRVEYKGEVLYVVTSLVYVVEEPKE